MRKLGLFFILLISIFSFKPAVVNASTAFTIGGSTLNTTNYISVSSGWKIIEWRGDQLYTTSNFPDYFAITLCTDAAPIVTWLNNRYNSGGGALSLEQVHVYNTDAKCMFPDSTYTGAHLVYIIGEQNADIGSSTSTLLIDSGLTIYNNATSSYSLISIQYSNEYIAYNAETNTLISQNAQIINGQNTINNSINNQTNAINNQTSTISDDTISTSSSSSFFSNFSTSDNGGISSVITAPLSFVRAMTNTCSPITFTIFDQEISLPCGTTLFWDKEEVQPFRDVWNVLLGGAFVYMLLRKVFMTIEDMKDPDSDKVSVIKL